VSGVAVERTASGTTAQPPLWQAARAGAGLQLNRRSLGGISMTRIPPSYEETGEALIHRHGHRLATCLNRPIDETWIAWNKRSEDWLEDEAVVLCVAGHSLAVNCWKTTEVALGWDCIDLASPPEWVADWGPEFALEWRRDALAPLAACVGRRIAAINALEHLHRITIVRSPNPSLVGKKTESWLLHGIEFVLEGLTLTIFNALDENGVTLEPCSGQDFRRFTVPRSA
jgi:hypothetical protein